MAPLETPMAAGVNCVETACCLSGTYRWSEKPLPVVWEGLSGLGASSGTARRLSAFAQKNLGVTVVVLGPDDDGFAAAVHCHLDVPENPAGADVGRQTSRVGPVARCSVFLAEEEPALIPGDDGVAAVIHRDLRTVGVFPVGADIVMQVRGVGPGAG